ncbi:hypothetical protein BH10PSE9_BH10PSE9_13520 [soil metagenome]
MLRLARFMGAPAMLRTLTGLTALALLAAPAVGADAYGDVGSGGVPYYAHHHVLPVCDDGGVLSKVVEKQVYYDTHIMGRGLTIEHFDGIREVKVDTDGPSLVPRRYCRATAWLGSGKKSEVVYLIEFQAGFASIHWGVQSCLPSYDPYRVYGAWCHSIR